MGQSPEARIDDVSVATEMETSFLSYALSVIHSRALPDVRDGCKPVQRRIMHSMDDLGLAPNTSYVKSARVVGDVIGRFHPHGDTAVYDALVRMAQDFSMSVPLVDGHGNFGTHADPAAAMRYTECRMAVGARLMTHEIDEDTVDMRPNYDGKLLEPSVLPAALPNLLVNGCVGIAVGMTTAIPPHNLAEVVAACRHLLAHPDAAFEDVVKHIPAPDMPTGALLLDLGGVHDLYRTGRGTFRLRARAQVVGRDIVITELPYTVGPEKILEGVKKLRDAGGLDEVSSAMDLTDRTSGMRLVITTKRHARGVPVDPNAVLRKLLKRTDLEVSVTGHMLALVDGQPQTLTLLQILNHYVAHRLEVTRRRSEHRRTKAQTRAHLLEGYLIALAAIDEVVAIIRGSRDADSARNKLMKSFKLTEVQAISILDMPLRRLTGLEVRKLEKELAELRATIEELTRYLTDPKAMRELVSSELGENARKLEVPRRTTITTITAADDAVADEVPELPDEPCRIELSTTGKLVRTDLAGHKGARTKEDALVCSIDASVRTLLGAVTNHGRLLHLHPIDVPVAEGRSKGVPVAEFVPDLSRDEEVVALVDAGPTGPMLALVTRNGVVKRVAAKDFAKASGQPVMSLKDADVVVAAFPLPAGQEDSCELVLVASNAQVLRFPASTVRPQGRTGGGVAGMRLADGASVLAAGAITEQSAAGVSLVTVSDAGGLKHTPIEEYPAKGRGGAGVRCQRMGRGETVLVSAAVAPLAQVAPVTASGALGKISAPPTRRDAMGEKGDVTRFAWHRA